MAFVWKLKIAGGKKYATLEIQYECCFAYVPIIAEASCEFTLTALLPESAKTWMVYNISMEMVNLIRMALELRFY